MLRHQITVLHRQLGTTRPRLLPGDRAFLAALLHRLPRGVLDRFRLLVRPDTVLRWHRNLVARRHAARSRPRRPGRPRTVRSVRLLVLRLARENPSRRGVTGASTASCSSWASRSLPPPSGRSSGRPGSTRHPAGLPRPGPASCARRLTHCSRATSSRPSPWAAPACSCWWSSSTPGAGSGSWARLLIPLGPGLPRPRRTWSWISRMSAAGCGS